MLRPCIDNDIDTILDIWLSASISAHDFIEKDFWAANMDAMRNTYLPASKTIVYEQNGTVIGFASTVDTFLAAIFVAVDVQGTGIGSQLLTHLKQQHPALSLTVYKENASAVRFYKRHNFVVENEQTDEHTGHQELLMTWNTA